MATHNQLFEPVTMREVKQWLGSISSIPLWQTFNYDKLTINVRKQELFVLFEEYYQ